MMAKYCLIRKTAGPDVTPPVISGVDSGTPGQMSAMITWMTDELADSQLQYGLTLSYGININQDTNPRVVSHSINLTGLTPGAFYYYRVRSADATANVCGWSAGTFTTAAIIDVDPPVFSGISYINLATTSVTIIWTTDEPADSQVDYGSTTGYGNSTTLDANRVLSHSVPITGLISGSLYHFRVKSRDAAGNLATSGDYSFTTTVPVLLPDLADNTYQEITGYAGKFLITSQTAQAYGEDNDAVYLWGGHPSNADFPQPVLSALILGNKRFAKALWEITKDSAAARELARRSGAISEAVLREWQRVAGLSDETVLGRLGTGTLKYTGFTGVERGNRVFGAVAGRLFARDMAKKLVANPADKTAARLVQKWTGLQPQKLIDQGGKLTEADELFAAKFFADKSQFRSTIVSKVEILNVAAANVTGAWFPIDTARKVIIFVTIANTITVEIELDQEGDAAKIISLGTFTSTTQKVFDDPTGRIRAKTSGFGAGSTAVVSIHKVYE